MVYLIDGIAVRIKCPSSTEDNVITDPGNYFCRKGFHALNVQGMCDAKKRLFGYQLVTNDLCMTR